MRPVCSVLPSRRRCAPTATRSSGWYAGRRPPRTRRSGSPTAGTVDAGALAAPGAVVHLAGVGLGEPAVDPGPPARGHGQPGAGHDDDRAGGGRSTACPTLVSASGVGYYGNPGDTGAATRTRRAATTYVADIAAAWEAATEPAAEARRPRGAGAHRRRAVGQGRCVRQAAAALPARARRQARLRPAVVVVDRAGRLRPGGAVRRWTRTTHRTGQRHRARAADQRAR